MPQWTRGLVTLLGYACHPMLPFLARGACMAIEDGYVLTVCWRQHDDVASALQVYETHPKLRVSRVQLGARERGQRQPVVLPG